MKLDENEQTNNSKIYGQQKVHEMVMKRYKMLRNGGILQTLQDIYLKQPESRIAKDNYLFSFENIKNHVEEKINQQSKLTKILGYQMDMIRAIQIKALREVSYDNQDNLYLEKLQSGLPIFKSIQFLRYQDNGKLTEFIGEQQAFIVDQENIDFNQIKFDINKIKLFLQDEQILPKINLAFQDQNSLQVKYDRFPTMNQIQKRADVMAKLLLFNIFSDQHRKLKQIWKNDQNYQDMQKNEKRLKAEMEPEKSKQGDNEQQDKLLRIQVKKILFDIEQRANRIANEQFKQLQGEKAVLTKKSLQKLKNAIKIQPSPRLQLQYLITYKQKRSW